MRRQSPLPPIVAACLALALLVYSRGWMILDPTSVAAMLAETDPSQFLVGWQFFRSEPWAMPPGAIHTLAMPPGASVGLTDSIPLLALPAKLVAAWLPADFHYFGLFLASSYAAMGILGVLLMRCATTSGFLQVLGAFYLVMNHVMLGVNAGALSANWILLWGLWINLRESPETRDEVRRCLLEWTALIVIAAWIHVYLCVMAVGFFAAHSARMVFIRKRAPLGEVVLSGVVIAILCGISFYLAGFFEIGFGALDKQARTQGINPKIFLRYPGNALGLGLGALFPFALVHFFRNRPGELLREYAPLVGLIGIYFFICLGNEVRFNGEVLFSYPATWLHAIFPASFRFLWPVYYAFAYFVLSQVVRIRASRRVIGLGLGLAFLLHIHNLWVQIDRRDRFAELAQHSFLSMPAEWNQLFSNFGTLYTLPPFHELIATRHGWELRDMQYFAYLAGKHRMDYYSGRLARKDRQLRLVLIEEAYQRIWQGELEPDTLVIMSFRLLRKFLPSADEHFIFSTLDNYVIGFPRESDFQVDEVLEYRSNPDLRSWLKGKPGETILVSYTSEEEGSDRSAVLQVLELAGSEVALPKKRARYFALLRDGSIIYEKVGKQASFFAAFEDFALQVQRDQTLSVGSVMVSTRHHGLNLAAVDDRLQVRRVASFAPEGMEFILVPNPARPEPLKQP